MHIYSIHIHRAKLHSMGKKFDDCYESESKNEKNMHMTTNYDAHTKFTFIQNCAPMFSVSAIFFHFVCAFACEH